MLEIGHHVLAPQLLKREISEERVARSRNIGIRALRNRIRTVRNMDGIESSFTRFGRKLPAAFA